MSEPKAFLSAELRWWGKGYLPQHLTTELKQLPYQDQPPRLDQYLHQQSILSSIKWRENGLEVKTMVKDPVDLGEEDTILGPITFWEKWRLPATMPIAGSSWLRLHKYRSVAMRGPGRQWLMQWPNDWLTKGCQLEWTKVEFQGRTYWTIGLEAFAKEGLEAAQEELLDGMYSLWEIAPSLRSVLRHSDRFDYPNWLKRHSSEGR